MTRVRWLLLIVVLAAVGVLVAALVAPGNDSSSDQAGQAGKTGHAGKDGGAAQPTTTTTVAASTTVPTTAAPPSTTAPPTTAAIPGACGNAGGAIRAAVDAGVPGAATGADVTECRLAASDAGWALVRLVPKAGSTFAATTVILQGGGSWAVVATGGVDAGCGKAPQQVIADLGQFCVGTGGGGR